MTDVYIYSFIVNGLLGLVMYFMKMSNDNMKADVKELQQEIKHVKDTYYKKEDFREFKEELWLRLDEIKMDFKREVERLQK